MINIDISTVAKVQPFEQKVLAVVNTQLNKHWSKYDFERCGIKGNIASSIHRLKSKGAIFEKVICDEMDNSGLLHKRIASYRLVGWVWC